MYEKRGHPLIPRAAFLWRIARHLGFALAIVLGALMAGMIGYRVTEHLPWIDAFLNAAMLLGGMGPVNPPLTDAGKLFAGIYAIFCGLMIIAITGVLLAPVVHRAMHHFHWKDDT